MCNSMILLAERYYVHQYIRTSTEEADLNRDFSELARRHSFSPLHTGHYTVKNEEHVHAVILKTVRIIVFTSIKRLPLKWQM